MIVGNTKKCGADAYLYGGSGKPETDKRILHTRMMWHQRGAGQSYRMMSAGLLFP